MSRFVTLLRSNKGLYDGFCELVFDDFLVRPRLGENIGLIQVVTPEFDAIEEKKALTRGWYRVVRTPFHTSDILRLATNFFNEYASNTIAIGRGFNPQITTPPL